ncbi:MAG: tetratricopeptide repeat protein [Actinomycetota bacterium]
MPNAEINKLKNDAINLYGAKKFDEAIAKYQQILKLDSKNVNAMAGVAACLQSQGYIVDAKKWYKSTLKIDPEYKFAKENLEVLKADDAIKDQSEVKVNPLVCPYCHSPLIAKQDKTVGIVLAVIGVLTMCLIVGIPIWVVGMVLMMNPKMVYYCPRCKRNVQF